MVSAPCPAHLRTEGAAEHPHCTAASLQTGTYGSSGGTSQAQVCVLCAGIAVMLGALAAHRRGEAAGQDACRGAVSRAVGGCSSFEAGENKDRSSVPTRPTAMGTRSSSAPLCCGTASVCTPQIFHPVQETPASPSRECPASTGFYPYQ